MISELVATVSNLATVGGWFRATKKLLTYLHRMQNEAEASCGVDNVACTFLRRKIVVRHHSQTLEHGG